MRLFAAGIATETNTFCPIPTGVDDFDVQRGSAAHQGGIEYPSLDLDRVWGRRARSRGDDFIFSLNAWAEPSGVTVKGAYESLRDEILNDLRRALPVDVVLLMLHGAMVAEGYDDCEEDLIRRVREVVGAEAVIGVELDLHCHLTISKIAAADIVVTYKEYPHVDIEARADELFEMAVATARGDIHPTMELFDCRMCGLYPTTIQPMRAFVDDMIEAERRSGVLSISFGHSFPFADLGHIGAKILVVTDGDPLLAKKMASEFGRRVYEMRRTIGFDTISLSMVEALTKARSSNRGPVVVADQSDNVGAGAPGDATFALRWLVQQRVECAATAILYDPEVVKIASKSGVGARISVRLGGKMGPSSGDPIDLDVTVLSMLNNYMHARPQQSGSPFMIPIGDVVALRAGGIDIVVGSRRCQCYCPSIFRDLGIDPTQKHLLMPKSYQHFYSAFSLIASEVIYMAGPGAAPPDPRQIPYHRLDRTGLYPWNESPLC